MSKTAQVPAAAGQFDACDHLFLAEKLQTFFRADAQPSENPSLNPGCGAAPLRRPGLTTFRIGERPRCRERA
jgi:hypothetical protein